MARHHITLDLTEDQEEFVKKLRNYDRSRTEIRYTANEELAMMAMTELRNMMVLDKEGFYD